MLNNLGSFSTDQFLNLQRNAHLGEEYVIDFAN